LYKEVSGKGGVVRSCSYIAWGRNAV